MKNLSEMMCDYFEDNTSSKSKIKKNSLLVENSMPISPDDCSWSIYASPERFYKEYIFDNTTQVLAFLAEVLKYQKSANHSGTQKIEDNKVSIEVYTHNIDRITELDQEYTRQTDFIYKDVLDFGI